MERVDEAARRLRMSRSAFLARAAEELVSRLESQILLERLDKAYADAPDEEEREVQRGMRRLARRTIGSDA